MLCTVKECIGLFFDELTRKNLVENFAKQFFTIISEIEVQISERATFESQEISEIEEKYAGYRIALCVDNKQRLKIAHANFLEVPPVNNLHTSDVEKRLLQLRDASTNKIRKVGAVLIRNGCIVGEGFNIDGGEACPKCSFFTRGESQKVRQTLCNHPHAEVSAIDGYKDPSFEDTVLIVTTAPCLECCQYIISKKIPLVIYLEEYRRLGEIDRSGPVLLNKAGVLVRKAGI